MGSVQEHEMFILGIRFALFATNNVLIKNILSRKYFVQYSVFNKIILDATTPYFQ